MLTLEERYNRKRTPVVSRPELATTPLVEPEIAGSQNPVAPTVDNTDETTPQANVGEPQMNDYQWNQRLYERLFQKPMSQEEEERRKRAASVATGIGHLGNVLSSFSNLVFAGEAPSQKLPTVADPKLQSYSDRLEAIRQRYGAGYLAARQNDMNNYQRALSLYRQDQARKAQNDLAKAKIAQNADQFAIKNDREERKMKQDAAYKEEVLGIKKANLRSLEQSRSAKANGSGGSKEIVLFGQGNEEFRIPRDKVDGFVMAAYQAMKDLVARKNKEIDQDPSLSKQEKEERKLSDIDDIKLTLGEGGDQISKARAIVGRQLSDFPELYPMLRGMLGDSSYDYRNINLDDDVTKENVNEKYSWIHGF